MTTTTSLSKNVRRLFEDLTPAEKANYVSMEWWKRCDESALGKEISAKITDLQHFAEDHVMTMPAHEYIAYLEILRENDIAIFGERFMNTIINGYSREILLLSALIEAKETIRDYLSDSVIQMQNEVAEVAISNDEMIAKCKARRELIKGELEDIMSRDFWEIRKIPRSNLSNNSDSSIN